MTSDFSSFDALGIADNLINRLAELGIDKPTPIQEQAIPALLSGQDLMGLAQTGTGKTAAYLLPLIQKLSEEKTGKGPRLPRVLVLAPTRELAHQVSISLRDFSRGITLRYVTICGGERYNNQISALKKGVDFIVATPGRFEDLQERGVIDLSAIEHVILDEADQMIDLGFYPAIKRICARTPQPRQTIFFSATMPAEMKALSDEFLQDQAFIKIESKNITADTVSQRAIMVSDALKRETLSKLLEDVDGDQVLVFVGTKRRADALGQFLSAQDYQADVLHGDMRQAIRSKVLRKFKSGQLQVLVATDVAARGIDVVGLNWVINYDLPQMPEIYVHRIGRTGRAQQSGRAISLCAPTQRGLLMAISRHVNGVIDIVNSNGEAIEIESFQAPSRQRRKGGRPFGGARANNFKGARRRSGDAEGRRRKSDERPRPERKPAKEGWHPDNADRSDRPKRAERADRPKRPERPERADRPDRSDRPARPDRPDRPDRRPAKPKGGKFKPNKARGDFTERSHSEESQKPNPYKKRFKDNRQKDRAQGEGRRFDDSGSGGNKPAAGQKPRSSSKPNSKSNSKSGPFRAKTQSNEGRADKPQHKKSSKGSAPRPNSRDNTRSNDGGQLRLKRPKRAKRA